MFIPDDCPEWGGRGPGGAREGLGGWGVESKAPHASVGLRIPDRHSATGMGRRPCLPVASLAVGPAGTPATEEGGQSGRVAFLASGVWIEDCPKRHPAEMDVLRPSHRTEPSIRRLKFRTRTARGRKTSAGGGGGFRADPWHSRPGLKVPPSPLSGRGSPLTHQNGTGRLSLSWCSLGSTELR